MSAAAGAGCGNRILFVEFVNADQFPGRVCGPLPVVAGDAFARGFATRWLRFGVSTTNLMENGRDEITLGEAELALLLRTAREHRPTLVVSTDPVFAPQLEALRAQAPGARFANVWDVVGKTLAEPIPWLYGDTAGLEWAEVLNAGVVPRYDWEPGNEEATRRHIDNVYVLQYGRCGHNEWVTDNPLYGEIDDPRVAAHLGCAFCSSGACNVDGSAPRQLPSGAALEASPEELKRRARTSIRLHIEGAGAASTAPSQWVALQVEGLAQTRGSRPPGGLLFEKLPAATALRRCIESLEARGLADGVRLLFAVRTDQAGRLEKAIEEHHARTPESRLRFGVYASGIESFAASDLLLFNKGTTPLDCLRAVRTFRSLARRYPGRFEYTGLSFILLTPWTTPDTLALNVGLLRFFGLTRKEAGNIFQARIRLHARLPLTWLAERDGLLEEEETDAALVMNRRKLFESERAWRFRDPRLRPLSRLMLRFDLLESELADPLTKTLASTLSAAVPAGKPSDDDLLLDLLACLVEEVRAHEAPLEEARLLELAAERLRSRRTVAPPAPARFRLGEERLELAAALERLAPLVAQGLKPLLSVDGVLPSELDSAAAVLAPLGLRHSLASLSPGAPGVLFVARDPAVVERASTLERALRTGSEELRRDVALELGALHGVPPCCARAHAEGPFAAEGASSWALFARRLEIPGAVPPELRPFLLPALAFVPCSFACESARATWRGWISALGLTAVEAALAPDVVQVLELPQDGDGDVRSVRVLASADEALRYDATALRGEAGALDGWLSSGDTLRFVPGQLRICRGEHSLAALTATHVVWSAERAWDVDEWKELAAEVPQLARARRGASGSRSTPELGAPADEQVLRREARDARIQRLAQALLDHFAGEKPSLSLGLVQLREDDAELEVRATLDGRTYELLLFARARSRPRLLETAHLALTHRKNTPIESAAHRAAISRFVTRLDAAMAKYMPELLPREPPASTS